jgi:hypothetical protein
MAPHSLSIFVCWHVSRQKLEMCKSQSLIFSDENHECWLPLAKKQIFAIQTYNVLKVLEVKGDQAQCKVFGDEGDKLKMKITTTTKTLLFYLFSTFFCFQLSLTVLCFIHFLKAHFFIINELFQGKMEV